MRFEVLLYDGCDELDALAPFEVLRSAPVPADRWQVELVTVDGASEIVTSRGVCLRTNGLQMGGTARPDVVVVPGGGWADRAPHGARTEAERGIIPRALAALHQNGVVLASVCTGAMLLASAGLLRNRPAITHHSAHVDLEAAGARLVRARVVDDGDVVTAGGVTSGLDLALWLIERFAGPAAAHQVEVRLEYERRGVVWKGDPDRP